MAKVEILYDPNTYYAIVQTEKFTKDLPLKCLNQSELENIADKQIGEELVFTSKLIFDTKDLSSIIKIHAPTGANAFYEECKNNVLSIKFYKLPGEQK